MPYREAQEPGADRGTVDLNGERFLGLNVLYKVQRAPRAYFPHEHDDRLAVLCL